MTKAVQRNRSRMWSGWLLVLALSAILIHVGVFYFFALDLKDPPERSQKKGFVFFQPEVPVISDELEQRAFLFDSEPLFLPTDRNFSGPIKTDASVWEPEVNLLQAFAPNIQWNDTLLLQDPVSDLDIKTPVEFLETVSRDFFSEFGAEAPVVVDDRDHGLFVEAKNAQGGLVLKTFIRLEADVGVEFPLNPVEFSVLYTDFGPAGEPLLINPSGSESTDNFVRIFILKQVHPLLLGLNGYFHVKIGL